MKPIHIEARYILKAPRAEVHRIVTDFENMPKHFPSIATSARYTKREGDLFSVELMMKNKKGNKLAMSMSGVVRPGHGFTSTNTFSMGVEEEIFNLTDVPEGTEIHYSDDLNMNSIFIRLFGAHFVKKSVLFNLERMIADLRLVVEK